MKHRQRPQIDWLRRQRPGHDVADRFQKCAAVVIDDALGVAGGARGVIERDRAALVGRRRPLEIRIASGDEFFIFDLAEPLARSRVKLVVEVDDKRRLFSCAKAGPTCAANSRSVISTLASLCSQDIVDGRGIEPRVDGVEHRA